MSENVMEEIPTEVLCRVFDFLTVQEQLNVTLTCRRWLEVLSAKRYLKKRMLWISSYFAHGLNKKDIKHYPVVAIFGTCDDSTFEGIRDYLYDDEVGQHLEELVIANLSYKKAIAKLIIPGKALHLPKLKNLRFNPIYEGYDEYTIDGLRKADLSSGEECYDMASALQIRDQIESLDIHLFKGGHQEACTERSFPNLRRLKMECGPGMFSVEDLRRYTNKLTEFELSVHPLGDPTILKRILSLATNVQKLIINTTMLYYSHLVNIENLTELSIFGKDEIYDIPGDFRLFTPNLTKLRTTMALATFFITKNLRSLDVNYSKGLVRPNAEYTTFFNRICQHLQVLSIEGINKRQSSFFVDQICTMTQLRTLKLSCSWIEKTNLERIFNELKLLRRVWIDWCSVTQNDWDCDPYFFHQLRAWFPKCVIIVPQLCIWE